jgi:hypothetical protein
MANQVQPPAAGRATSSGFDDLRKQVALSNEQAQKKARKLRDARDQARILARRQGSAL